MYIHDFLASLSLLKNPRLPDDSYPDLPMDAITYLYYITIDNRSYLYYSTADGLNLKIDVTEECGYLQRLNDETIDLEHSIAKDDVERAILEAVWLFDVLSACSRRYINLIPAMCFSTLYAFYTNNETELGQSVLSLFDNNILFRDIGVAQARYFIKSYVKHSPYYTELAEETNTESVFEWALTGAIVRYGRNATGNYLDSYSKTGRKNKELEDFIQQIEYKTIFTVNTPEVRRMCRIIHDMRLKQGLTPEALAKRAKISVRYAHKIERCEACLTFEDIFMLGLALNSSGYELLRKFLEDDVS